MDEMTRDTQRYGMADKNREKNMRTLLTLTQANQTLCMKKLVVVSQRFPSANFHTSTTANGGLPI